MGDTSIGLKENIAGLLCYALGWITGLVFFLIEKENKFVRFHALQSLITFGVLTIAFLILPYIPGVGGILGWILRIIMLVLWILLMIKAFQGEKFKVPVVGDIAEKKVG